MHKYNVKLFEMKNLFRYVLIPLFLIYIIASCANVGKLEGGPMDFNPPVMISSTPASGALNVKKNKITLHFDEYIKLEKISEKVFVSPPQLQQPEIKASGKNINITLLDSLKENSTYTIDFSDAISDNNEGNPLENFAFSFSTGNSIDSLEVSGTVLDATNLEPIKGIMVGIHTIDEDSMFMKKPFERAARTDSKGQFRIKGLANKKFKIYALADNDQNAAFTQKTEMIAFVDSLITPLFDIRQRQDTVWYDTIQYDTIIERTYTHYLPDNVVLRAFKEETDNRFFRKAERTENKKMTILFKGKSDTIPTIKGINFDLEKDILIETNKENDSIVCWIKDSIVYNQDTLKFTLDYYYTDSLNNMVLKCDTVNAVFRTKKTKAEVQKAKKKSKDEDEEDEKPKTVFLQMNVNAPMAMEVYGNISIKFDEPIKQYNKEMIHLQQKVDTLWKDVSFDFEQDTTDFKLFNIYHDWEPKKEYRVQIDSLAFQGLYGLHTDKSENSFKVKSEDEYFTLIFDVTGADAKAFIELLDTRDNVVRRRRLENSKAEFYYLAPGKYAARLVNDVNGNGKWDTGDYKTKRQPEEVFYYHNLLEYKAMWEATQEWNIREKIITEQKPMEIRKQKPDLDRRKNKFKKGYR